MKRPSGLKGFVAITMGQTVSITGTGMTQFGLSFWVWQQYGKATPFSIMNVLFFGAQVIFGLVAGSLIDRWSRKVSLILPDVASGVLTLMALYLYSHGNLTLAFLYAMSLINGMFSALQFPAYSVTLAAMLKPEEYTRANALFSLTDYGPALIAPILAGGLLNIIGLQGIMAIDILTLMFAVAINMWVFIPPTVLKSNTPAKGLARLWEDISTGFRFIMERKELLTLLIVFLLNNFFAGFGSVLISPYILARTNNNPVAAGTVESFMGIGGLLGAGIFSFYVVRGRKILPVLWGDILIDAGSAFLGMARSLIPMCGVAALSSFGGVMANTHSQAIWQSIVPIDLQGRVFSARRFMAEVVSIIPTFLSGPIVDYYLVPYFTEKNIFTSTLGSGPAGAMAFAIVIGSLVSIAVSVWAMANPSVMHVEDLAQSVSSLPTRD